MVSICSHFPSPLRAPPTLVHTRLRAMPEELLGSMLFDPHIYTIDGKLRPYEHDPRDDTWEPPFRDSEVPLIEACTEGWTEHVAALIAKGHDVNRRGDEGDSPLIEAALANEPEIIKLLLAAGAKINQHNNAGGTPLWHACMRGNKEAAAVLLEKKAKIEKRAVNGSTPSQYGFTTRSPPSARAAPAWPPRAQGSPAPS